MRFVVCEKRYVRSVPRMASKIETVIRPKINTSSVLMPRWTSTLSMITWKKSGVTRAKICRKNEATSTSDNSSRYLWIAPRNHVRSKRRLRSVSCARRVIRTRRSSQTASKSACVMKRGLGELLPVRPQRTCFEAHILGTAQHLSHANTHAAKAVPDLLAVGTDALEAQQHHQGGQAGIDRVLLIGLYRHVA